MGVAKGGKLFEAFALLSCVAADGKADDDHRIKDNEKAHSTRTHASLVREVRFLRILGFSKHIKTSAIQPTHHYSRIHERDLYAPPDGFRTTRHQDSSTSTT